MDNYPMNPTDGHYTQQTQRQQQQWPPHLLPPSHPQAPFPSPPASSIGEHGQHYPPFYQQQQQQQQPGQQQQSSVSGGGSEPMNHINRTTSSLSLNLSSLTVTSPTNLSPINPPSATAASSALSPATPISPSTNPFNHAHAHPHHHNLQSQFQFSPPDQPPSQQQQQQNTSSYDEHTVLHPPGSASSSAASPYDNRRTPGPSRSSSTSSQLPRKRSFTSNASSSSVGGTLVEEMYDEARDAAMELVSGGGAYTEDLEMRGPYQGGGGSPVDGSGSTSGAEDALGGAGAGGHAVMGGMAMGITSIGSGVPGGVGGSMNVLGKPMATNNFVTKLYQMINDSKSAHFIAWTELGTSFVVSNVGEFSRSILGSHFKHNNFSSFVRQLNMYGFHKINRTPRAQRTSTDAQTWEFSHHKFLRGRPDLLDEIKRKALEPDPALKHRVELPGEVAAQLGAMRDENRRVWEQLSAERRRVEKLVGVVGRLWDVVGKGFPGSVPPFPTDLLDESPNIYITSPTSTTSRFPPPLTMNMSSQSLHSMHSLSSPNSSPTAADFPSHLQQHQQHHPQNPHSLSRQHSFQHVSFSRGEASSTPLPASPGSITMELFDDGGGGGACEPPPTRGGTKRQRLSNDDDGLNGVNGATGSVDSLSSMSAMSSPGTGAGSGLGPPGKKLSRARSDSAPLGYGFGGLTSWQSNGVGGVAGRPRSGSGLAGPRGVPNIGNMTRGNGTPLLSISTVPSTSSNR